MKEKIELIFQQVNTNRNEISEIISSGKEIYFKFRGRVFSVNSFPDGSVFYVYPKYHGSLVDIVNAMDHGVEHDELTFVSLYDDKDEDKVSEFYSWIYSKHVGLEGVMRDIGL